MTRESDKGHQLILDGRLVITYVKGPFVTAKCHDQDDDTSYELGHNRHVGWHCNCPAPATCSHLHALMLVTDHQREATP